jgi:plastocyanin
MKRPARNALAAAIALITALVLVAGATAAREGRTIKIMDKCDPATFNAAVGPGTCVGDGDVTFADFVNQVTKSRKAGAWRFAPDHTSLEAGSALTAINSGGETHTFTMVAEFGPGFVPFLNDLVFGPGSTPIPEFNPPNPATAMFLPPGAMATLHLARGTYKFQCGIHPWMRTTVTVED